MNNVHATSWPSMTGTSRQRFLQELHDLAVHRASLNGGECLDWLKDFGRNPNREVRCLCHVFNHTQIVPDCDALCKHNACK